MTTTIEWTNETWNAVTGCDRVSPGCDHCYALAMAKRLKAMGSPKYQTDGDPRTSGPGFGLAMHDDVLTLPLRWRKPRRVFVNSMSDLFHPRVTDDFIARVFAVMAAAPQHFFQLLTKRPARMRALLGGEDGSGHRLLEATSDEDVASLLVDATWPLRNVHVGVSVEDQERAAARIPALLDTPAAVRWLSCEPLLGPLDLTRVDAASRQQPQMVYDTLGRRYGVPGLWQATLSTRVDWVVIGGESGPGARPMELPWAQSLVDQCQTAGTPVFVKQLGSAWGARHHDIDLFPEGLRVREYPAAA